MTLQANNLCGFQPLNSGARIGVYKAATGLTVAAGDLVTTASGQVSIASSATATAIILGVAVSAVSNAAANDPVEVYDDPEQLFIAKADGSMASKYTGTTLDITGATNAQVLNADTDTYHHVELLRQFDTSEDNAAAGVRWVCRINGDLHILSAGVNA